MKIDKKIYYYTSGTNFEHYWNGNVYITIQITEVPNLLSYAAIYSQMTNNTKEFLEGLLDKNELTIISEDVFNKKLKEAINIIRDNC